MKTDSEKFETLGQLIDQLESLSLALNLQIPDRLHIEAFRKSLPEIVDELKASYVEITNENPWS